MRHSFYLSRRNALEAASDEPVSYYPLPTRSIPRLYSPVFRRCVRLGARDNRHGREKESRRPFFASFQPAALCGLSKTRSRFSASGPFYDSGTLGMSLSGAQSVGCAKGRPAQCAPSVIIRVRGIGRIGNDDRRDAGRRARSVNLQRA